MSQWGWALRGKPQRFPWPDRIAPANLCPRFSPTRTADGTAEPTRAGPVARLHRGSTTGVSLSAAVLIGILGCGRAAERIHLPALAGITDARLTAAYDPGPERRDLIARAAPGLPAFRFGGRPCWRRGWWTPSSCPRRRTPTPNSTVQALRRGVPALVDAPLALTAWTRRPGSGRRSGRSGVAAMVGFNRRWWAPAVALRHHLSAGAGGRRGDGRDAAGERPGARWRVVARRTPCMICGRTIWTCCVS